jgi:predicted metal-dependent HD superfamily phosphohydrolase
MVDECLPEFFAVNETEVASLENDLQGLLGSFSGDEGKTVESANLLISKYSEKHRAYHNLSHIKFLLRTAAVFKDKINDYEAFELAVWFHDAIYEPKSKTNEPESAALAVENLAKLNFPQPKIEKVEKMILATRKHDAAGLDEDGRLFLDSDLGILGAKAEIYKKYAEAIRKEYSFVPENLYRSERGKVLRSFLRREFIFYTGIMRESLEEAARINIENEIEELS